MLPMPKESLRMRHQLFQGGRGSSFVMLRFEASGHLKLTSDSGAGGGSDLVTTATYDDTEWHHIVVSWDTTQAVSSDRARLYVDGVRVTDFGTEIYRGQDEVGGFNGGVPHWIGQESGGGAYLDGRLASVQVVDGQALDSDAFGRLDGGVWVPSSYEGSYGTTGFHLDFSDAGSLGRDASGNGNDVVASGGTHLGSTGLEAGSPLDYTSTSGNDALIGGADGETLSGGAGRDLLAGGGGDDVLDGGGGLDTAVFAGNLADYVLAEDATSLVVTALSGGEGTDRLTGISNLWKCGGGRNSRPSGFWVNPKGFGWSFGTAAWAGKSPHPS